jgi:hypothetical protein
MIVQIVFIKADLKWEISIDGVNHLVDIVEIKCKSVSNSGIITCKAKNVSIKKHKGEIKATIL